MAEMLNKSGMSRAAQNKRKKQLKGAHLSGLKLQQQMQHNHESDDSMSDEEKPTPAKKKRIAVANVNQKSGGESFIGQDSCQIRSIDFISTTIQDILDMQEVVEVTSKERSSLLMAKFIHPTNLLEFYTNHWEKRPLHCPRNNKKYFRKLLTKKDIAAVFSEHIMYQDADIRFSNETGDCRLGSDGKFVSVECESTVEQDEDDAPVEVSGAALWAHFAKGYTVTCGALQKFNDDLWRLLSALEHEFSSRVWAEAVLAPAGGAPCHPRRYDATDALVLQLEGSSRWCVYEPAKGQELPRESGVVDSSSGSSNLDGDGAAATSAPSSAQTDVVLAAGDSLYVPKGWSYVQYGCSAPDPHSLCLKLRTNQGLSAADLLQVMLPQALAQAAQDGVQFRRALPRDYRAFLGVAVSEEEAQEARRAAFQQRMQSLLARVAEAAVDLLDPAADQLAKQFMMERLPVPLTAAEEALSAAANAKITLFPYTRLRMTRPGAAIVLVEDGKVVVYHCMDNSRELFGSALQSVEFELDDGPAVEGLLGAYPEGVAVADLEHPGGELDDKLGVAEALFREGFLLVDDEASKPAPAAGRGSDQDDDDPF